MDIAYTKWIFIGLIISLTYAQGISQFTQGEIEGINDTVNINAPEDTIQKESNNFLDIFYGKPGKAAFYSLIIPGGGQFYNKRYWKIPLVYALEGSTVYWYLWNNSRFNEWQEAYLGLLNDDINMYRGITDPSRARQLRDRFRKNREYAVIFIILGHLLNVFDAFIDRHLIDFDIDDDLSYYKQFNDPWGKGRYAIHYNTVGLTFKIPLGD